MEQLPKAAGQDSAKSMASSMTCGKPRQSLPLMVVGVICLCLLIIAIVSLSAESNDCKLDCSNRQIASEDCTCLDCLPYTKASDDGKECLGDSCGDHQMLLINGTCRECGPYLRAQEDGKACGSNNCDDGSILLEDGTCHRCEAYTRAQEAGKVCGRDECNENQALQQDGTCEDARSTIQDFADK